MSEDPLLSFLKFRATLNASLADNHVIAIRYDLAEYTSRQFLQVAIELRKTEANDTQKRVNEAIALILEIGSS